MAQCVHTQYDMQHTGVNTEMAKIYRGECYCTNMRRSCAAVTAFYDNALKESGVTAAQYYLLVCLKKLEQANISKWAEETGLDRTTLTRNIRPLEEHGIIERIPGHGKVYHLSAAGQQAAEQARSEWESAQKQMESLLGLSDAKALRRISVKLQNSIS